MDKRACKYQKFFLDQKISIEMSVYKSHFGAESKPLGSSPISELVVGVFTRLTVVVTWGHIRRMCKQTTFMHEVQWLRTEHIMPLFLGDTV